MTVAELIAKLQQFDPNERVCADSDVGACDIIKVTLQEAEPADELDHPSVVRARHVLIW